jgi:hypothetical protein
MPDTTGRIRAKALDTTGMTEAMLDKDWGHGAGRTRMAVVELRTVEPHGPNLDGKKRIDYVIESIEPVPTDHEDRVREFQRGLFLARPEQEGQAVLQGTAGETSGALATAAAGLDAAIERDDDGNVTGVWDGNTDGPLEVPEPPEGGYCPFPGCAQEDGHDGDHDPTDDDTE